MIKAYFKVRHTKIVQALCRLAQDQYKRAKGKKARFGDVLKMGFYSPFYIYSYCYFFRYVQTSVCLSLLQVFTHIQQIFLIFIGASGVYLEVSITRQHLLNFPFKFLRCQKLASDFSSDIERTVHSWRNWFLTFKTAKYQNRPRVFKYMLSMKRLFWSIFYLSFSHHTSSRTPVYTLVQII